MSDGERLVIDASGRFRRDDETPTDGWRRGRILLSDRRVILVDAAGKDTVALSAVEAVAADHAAPGDVDRATLLRTVAGPIHVAVDDQRPFELALCSALLSGDRLLGRLPDADRGWVPARIGLAEDGTVEVAMKGGSIRSVDPANVTSVKTGRREVAGESRTVVVVDHGAEGATGRVILAAADRGASALVTTFGGATRGPAAQAEEPPSADTLGETEVELLLALYSGVSPFHVPEFTDEDVDTVEAAYERLVELGVLSQVRTRREVELTPRGRNLASHCMGGD